MPFSPQQATNILCQVRTQPRLHLSLTPPNPTSLPYPVHASLDRIAREAEAFCVRMQHRWRVPHGSPAWRLSQARVSCKPTPSCQCVAKHHGRRQHAINRLAEPISECIKLPLHREWKNEGVLRPPTAVESSERPIVERGEHLISIRPPQARWEMQSGSFEHGLVNRMCRMTCRE